MRINMTDIIICLCFPLQIAIGYFAIRRFGTFVYGKDGEQADRMAVKQHRQERSFHLRKFFRSVSRKWKKEATFLPKMHIIKT
jgi:hypothetical protein